MEIADVSELRTFDDDSFAKNSLFETERLFVDVYCFEPGQSQSEHVHDDADKIYQVLDGEATVLVDGQSHVLGEGEAIIAHAGESHGLRNESDERLRVLVTMAWGSDDRD